MNLSEGSKSSEFALVVVSVAGVLTSVWTGDLEAAVAVDYLKWAVGLYVLGRSAKKAVADRHGGEHR